MVVAAGGKAYLPSSRIGRSRQTVAVEQLMCPGLSLAQVGEGGKGGERYQGEDTV